MSRPFKNGDFHGCVKLPQYSLDVVWSYSPIFTCNLALNMEAEQRQSMWFQTDDGSVAQVGEPRRAARFCRLFFVSRHGHCRRWRSYYMKGAPWSTTLVNHSNTSIIIGFMNVHETHTHTYIYLRVVRNYICTNECLYVT